MLSSRSLLLVVFFTFQALPAWCGSVDVVFFDNRFGVLDDVSGDYKQIGTLPLSVSSGIAYMNGTLYLEDAGYNLLTADPVTGASRVIGATGVKDAAAVFAGGANGLYEVDFASDVYRIDAATGRGTLVGATGLSANNGALDTSLSSDGKSLFYTAGKPGVSDELYRINIATGAAMDLGSSGVTGVAGSAYVNGRLELYQYGQSSNYLYSAVAGSIEFKRGAPLGVQPIDGGAVVNALNGGPAASTLTPEPASFVLLGAGLLFLGWRGRGKGKR